VFSNDDRIGITTYGVKDQPMDYTVPTDAWTHLLFSTDGKSTVVYSSGRRVATHAIVVSCPMKSFGRAPVSGTGSLGEVKVGLLSRLDSWIRRRLRSLVWIHWKTRRNRVAQLEKRGISHQEALYTGCARKGAVRMGGRKWVSIALPNKTFEDLGLRIPWI
jgi:hypothetical protein